MDCFEEIISRFSRVKVHRFLDMACGPNLQLRKIARGGYEAVELDVSKEMLEYLCTKAQEKGLRMNSFKLT